MTAFGPKQTKVDFARWMVCPLMAHSGHSRHRNILSAIGIRADNGRPLLGLFSRSFDLVVDDLSRFREGFGIRSRMELCAKLELSAWRAPFHQPPQTPARLAVLKQQIENKSPGFLDLCVESCRAKGKASLPSTNQ